MPRMPSKNLLRMNMQYATVVAKKRQVIPANVLPKSAGLRAKCALENNIDIIAHVVIRPMKTDQTSMWTSTQEL